MLRAVFLALKEVHYCDSNVPAMDKLFHLMKRAEDAILKSTKELDGLAIFGLCCSEKITSCEDEFVEIYGEDDENSDNDEKVQQIYFNVFKSVSNVFPVFQMLTVT